MGPGFQQLLESFHLGVNHHLKFKKLNMNPSSHSLHLYFLLGLHLITQVVNLRVLLDSQTSFPHANQPSRPNNFTCLIYMCVSFLLLLFVYKIKLLLCISGSLQNCLIEKSIQCLPCNKPPMYFAENTYLCISLPSLKSYSSFPLPSQ